MHIHTLPVINALVELSRPAVYVRLLALAHVERRIALTALSPSVLEVPCRNIQIHYTYQEVLVCVQ